MLLAPATSDPSPFQNRKLSFEGRAYEVFWTSQQAWHIAERYFEPTHRVTHLEIAAMITDRDALIIQTDSRRSRFYVYARFSRRCYVTAVAFNEMLGRCVIYSSHIESNAERITRYNDHKASRQSERLAIAQASQTFGDGEAQ
jgi:hypothetical protein